MRERAYKGTPAARRLSCNSCVRSDASCPHRKVPRLAWLGAKHFGQHICVMAIVCQASLEFVEIGRENGGNRIRIDRLLAYAKRFLERARQV